MKITKTRETITREYFGVPLKISRMHSQEHMEKARRLRKPHQRRIDKQTLPAEVAIEIAARSMGGTVLVGWDQDKLAEVIGEQVPFSEEAAEDLLLSDRDCREFVADVASDLDQFLKEDEERIVGES